MGEEIHWGQPNDDEARTVNENGNVDPRAYGGIPQASYGPPSGGYANVPPPPPVGWTPPPKPGLLPLRPLSFGALLGTPFQVLRRNPGPTFGSALITQLVTAVVSLLAIGGAGIFAIGRIDSAAASDKDEVAAGSIALVIVAALIPLALSILSSALLQGVLVVEVARGTLGEKNRMGALWRAAGRRLWPLVAWFATLIGLLIVAFGALIGVAIVIGLLGGGAIVVAVLLGVFGSLVLLAACVWLGTKTALVPSIIVLERVGMLTAVRRSWRLTNGYFWKTFGVLALINVILYAATQIVSTPLSFVGSLASQFLFPTGGSAESSSAIAVGVVISGLTLLVTLVLGAITAVVQSSAAAVVYIDLRMRKEGLDLELLRFVEARQAGTVDDRADPFLDTVLRNG
ncbi:hypothetical protein [Agreia sp. COWG]|uniref:hypothetical protein n=1 Tax=Agreia sp. COWG TaxID=2773266 RepID=UPI001926DE34|nr:hypothetical protein [Agreia sp. COWG]CAD5993550.1 conserved membrane protein of unknown function [Agreia sp. COWG]